MSKVTKKEKESVHADVAKPSNITLTYLQASKIRDYLLKKGKKFRCLDKKLGL